jgi:hypothetical protein
MSAMDDVGNWMAAIPAHPAGTTLYYYIEGAATSGKVGTRPMPAPDGWWSFKVIDPTVGIGEWEASPMAAAYPNPASAITSIPMELRSGTSGSLVVYNALGAQVDVLHQGHFPAGYSNYFLHANRLAAGPYLIVFQTDEGEQWSQHLMVK